MGVVGKVFWLLMAIVSQSAWGFYGVCCRFLQVQAGVPPLYLTFLITALASVSLLMTVSLPTSAYYTIKSCTRKRGEDDDDDDYDGLPGEGKPFGITRAKYAVGCGLAYFVLTVTNVGALQLTQAYYVQLVFISLPIFVSILNRIFFSQRAPAGLWTCIFFVGCGVGLVVYGGSLSSAAALTSKDAVGFVLSGVAVFCLALFLILAQSSHGYLTHDQVLWAAFFTQLTVSLFLSKWAEGVDLSVLTSFTHQAWGFLIAAGVGVMFGANWMQQLVVRKIGAPLMSMFCPLNLVAATAGSYYVLDEKLGNWFQGGGLLLVAFSIFFFLLFQMRAR